MMEAKDLKPAVSQSQPGYDGERVASAGSEPSGPVRSRPAYIFLDVDGVLNSLRSCVAFGGYKTEHLDTTAIRLLGHLCRKLSDEGLDPAVVLSSTWRMRHPHPDFWHSLFSAHGCGHVRFVGCTPDFHDIEPNRRGREIAAWMADNAPGAPYVCLDDDSDFLPDQPLVLTSHLWGLGCDEIDEAFHVLTGKRLFMSTLRTDGKWKAVRAIAREHSSPLHVSQPIREAK